MCSIRNKGEIAIKREGTKRRMKDCLFNSIWINLAAFLKEFTKTEVLKSKQISIGEEIEKNHQIATNPNKLPPYMVSQGNNTKPLKGR